MKDIMHKVKDEHEDKDNESDTTITQKLPSEAVELDVDNAKLIS